MQKMKILGLALVAMFSMSAVAAVSASADTLTAAQYPAILTGEPDGEFKDTLTTTAGNSVCPGTKYDATISGPVSTAGSLAVTPTFPAAGCTAFGFPSTIDANGCTFVFRVLVGTAGDVDIECPGATELTVTARSGGVAKCTIHIKTQTDLGGTVKFTNTAAGGTVEANLSGIDYTHTQGTGLGACPSGSATNGTLVFKAIFKAETDPGGVPVNVVFS